MSKGQMTLNNRYDNLKRYALVAIVIAMFMTMTVAVGVPYAAAINNGVLNNLLTVVIDIVGSAATIIGIVIIIWGVFQMVMAFRREDSEGISKQITTVVVGGVLVGFKGIISLLRGAAGV